MEKTNYIGCPICGEIVLEGCTSGKVKMKCLCCEAILDIEVENEYMNINFISAEKQVAMKSIQDGNEECMVQR